MVQRVLNQRAGVRGYLSTRLSALAMRDGLSLNSQVVVFLLVFAALFSRRPGLFVHPQFYAEDGTFWYAQAYNGGWIHSLALSSGGYLNTLQRLVAGLSLWFPFAWAPLLMAMAGMLIQVLPVNLLLSVRCRSWASLPTRCLFAAAYVAIPNALEIHVVLTNAQWHYALALAILAFSDPPARLAGYIGDLALFAIGSVSGPFGLLLFPLMICYGWLRRQNWSFVLALVLAAGSALQVWELLHSTGRGHTPLGATVALFLKLLGGHVFIGAMLGSSGLASWPGLLPLVAAIVADCLGLVIIFYSMPIVTLSMRLFAVFVLLVYAASLKSPLFPGTMPLWQDLAQDGGGRYWFFPMLVFLWCTISYVAKGQNRFVRFASVAVLICLPLGVARNWYYRGPTNEHFDRYVDQLKQARPGEHVIIPIVPQGMTMDLVKRAS